jgi:hypothetical protein
VRIWIIALLTLGDARAQSKPIFLNFEGSSISPLQVIGRNGTCRITAESSYEGQQSLVCLPTSPSLYPPGVYAKAELHPGKIHQVQAWFWDSISDVGMPSTGFATFGLRESQNPQHRARLVLENGTSCYGAEINGIGPDTHCSGPGAHIRRTPRWRSVTITQSSAGLIEIAVGGTVLWSASAGPYDVLEMGIEVEDVESVVPAISRMAVFDNIMIQPAATPADMGSGFHAGPGRYIEIADSDDFSISPRGLTVSMSISADSFLFSRPEGSGYVYILGKGSSYGLSGDQEFACRVYSDRNSENRPRRISCYVFSPQGGQGIGSNFQDTDIKPGQWIDVTAVFDGSRSFIFRDGRQRDCDFYRSGHDGTCFEAPFQVQPTNGHSPLRIGTLNGDSYFEGRIRNVRIWKRALSAGEVMNVHLGNIPRSSLVAEYTLDGGSPMENTGQHPGRVVVVPKP